MPLGIGETQHGLERQTVGPVLVGLETLVLHDGALVVELLLCDARGKEAHAVRFEPQGQIQVAGRKRLVVVRPVEPRGAVERPARVLDELEVLVVADVLRALEQQVLEEVREARPPGPLVLRAHVVHEVDRHDRHGPVLVKDHAKAVVEDPFLEVEANLGGSGARRRGSIHGDRMYRPLRRSSSNV